MEVLTPVIISLKIALISTAIVLCLGVFLARVMTHSDFFGKGLVESVITLPLVLPPTVIGFALLLTFGNNGPLGKLINTVFHRQIIFTWEAGVIAAIVVAFPLLYRNARTAFEEVDPKLEMAARTLGASELKVFFTITLPLARYGVLSGLVMAFARALGEFGATLMIAGNIPGKTQSIPLAIYFALESGDTALAGYYVLTMTVIAFIAVTFVNRWSGKKHITPVLNKKGWRDKYVKGEHTKRLTGLFP